MPTDSPQKSSDDILQDIVEGNYTKFTSLADFKTILNQILIDIECEDSQNKQNFLNFECGSPEGKNLGTHFFLQSTLGKGLNNIFDLNAEFIILNKDNLSDDIIKKLILLGTHYTTMYEVKINEVNSSFNENDIITTSSFLNFVTSLFNIPNITEFETPRLIHTKGENIFPNITFGDSQNIDILIGDTIKLSEDLIHILGFKRYSYEKNLLDFLKSLGNLGFGLKIKEDFQDFSHKVQEIANKTIWSTDFKNFSKEDRELAGYTFLYAFNDKNTDQIKLDCVELLGLEHCPRPATASTRLFQQIAQGNYINQRPSFADFTLVENEVRNNLPIADRDQTIHILTFLKNVLKTNNGSKNTFNFKNLYGFAFNSIDNLSRDLQQKNMLDDSFSQAAESLSFFLFNIVKNNVNNQDLLDQIHIVTQFSKLYENIIVHAPHLNSLSDTMGNHLFSILARNIDSEPALQTGYSDFIKIITSLNKVCRENTDACNLAKILAGSFKSLGSISRKSSGYARNATREAKALIESTRNNINPEQLSDAVSFFFKANISQTVLNQKCKEIFNLTGCRPANFIDLDNLAYGEIDEITTTLLPQDLDTSVTTSTPQISTNATIASAINQTTPAVIVDPIAATELPGYSNNSIAFNQTGTAAIETSRNDTALSNSEIQIGAAAGYGAGMGAYNAIMRHFYPNSVMLNIVGNAAFAASFPLMLFGMQEYMGSDTQDQNQLTWLDMAWQIPTNFGHAMVWNTGLYLVNVAANDISSLVSSSTRLQFATKHIATNTLPFVATVASVIKKPIETGVQMGASMASSSITSGLLNLFFPRKKIKTSDIEAGEKKDVEMEILLTPSSSSSSSSESTVSFGKKIILITEGTLIKMIQDLKIIIQKVKELSQLTTSQYFRDQLNTRLAILEICYDDLNENREQFNNACKIFNNKDECESEPSIIKLRVWAQTLKMELKEKTFHNAPQNLTDILSKIEGPYPEKNTTELTHIIFDIRAKMEDIFTATKSLGSSPVVTSSQVNKRRHTIMFDSMSASSSEASRTSSSEVEEFHFQTFYNKN